MSLWNKLFGKKDEPLSRPQSFSAPVSPVDSTHVPPSHTKPASPASRPVAAPAVDTSSPQARREIRVFISSTFRDMQEERELLVKKVFPELRRICDERFVSFTEVDLRWGITGEEAAEGKVLPICLEEIHTCRPYFIGILGERYGWIPDTVPQEVLDKEPWIQEHICHRTSVTELEILHGVLRNPKMDGHAFFYFRDPAYAAQRGEDFQTENPDSAGKLAALKETIRHSGRPFVDPYKKPEDLADSVKQHFIELIDQLYPKEQVPDPLDQEAIGHRSYARRKLLAYVDRPSHSQALAAFVAAPSTGQGMVVTGDSGGGKTALLAAFASSVIQQNTSFVFEHYFGATPDSASVDGFLRRMLCELKRLADIKDEMPTTPEEMREVLPLWLAQTTGGQPIVLVLDALNQIQGDEADRHLNWLPRFFPAHIRVVASSLAGPSLDALRERDWAEHVLPLADTAERGRMIDSFLEIHRKQLGEKLRGQIVQAAGTANPLFLHTVLEQLRQFGSFEKLPHQVAEYLKATTPQDLFRQVIQRWQHDFHAGRDIVARSLRHLWAARQGLSENEWLELLADESGPMDRQTWRPLLLAMEPHLVQRGSLWAFGHDFLRQAVDAELISTDKMRKQARLALADYFDKHPSQTEITPRKAAEWPFQLHASEAWERLEACLTDIPLFLTLYNDETKWELTGYWHPLRKKVRDMGVCYIAAYNSWAAVATNAGDHYVPAQLGGFLSNNGLYHTAEPLLRRALEVSERELGAEHSDTLAALNNLAVLLERKGDYAGAQPMHERALEASERVMGAEHPDTLLIVNNLARLLDNKGDYAGAQPLYERALEASDRVLGAEHPYTLGSMNNLAGLLVRKGDYAGAQPLLERALEARERVLGAEHPYTLGSVNDLASLLRSKGDYAGAQPLYERALEASARVMGAEHPDALLIMNNLAGLLESKGDYAGAQSLYERALETSDRVLGAEHPSTPLIMNNLAGLLVRKGDYAGAHHLLEKALETSERVKGAEHADTLISVNNLAFLLKSKGDYAGARPLYERALEGLVKISQAIHRIHPNLEGYVGNYAICMENLGCSSDQVRNTLAEIYHRYGLEIGEAGRQAENQPSAKLQLVLDEIMRDESKAPEIAARLQLEDPTLFTELVTFIQSQQDGGNATTESTLEQRHAAMRQTASEKIREGRYAEAGEILEQLLAAGFEIPGTYSHLARISLLADRSTEARVHADLGWEHRAKALPYVIPRLLWLQLAAGMLEDSGELASQPATVTDRRHSEILGRMKTALHKQGAFMEWTMQSVLDNIRPKLPEESMHLLTALIAALNSPEKLPALDDIPPWRDAEPQPID